MEREVGGLGLGQEEEIGGSKSVTEEQRLKGREWLVLRIGFGGG